MAARWGTGDETLTACNMEFFPMDTLDETAVLSSGETLEALQSCLDPSILSLFEDTPTIETKGIDEESEATLLTALTEILDNVDDENLSPFDTLPDSELLSGHKGREHSPVSASAVVDNSESVPQHLPSCLVSLGQKVKGGWKDNLLRRLLCLSRSPPEKDTLCGARPSSIGKSLPRIRVGSLQRSDGEEEEDGSLTLSPIGQGSSPDNNLLDWGSLTVPLPVTFEQEGENGVSVSLGDFVRQMHPYCMAICVENEEGEQLLPEGGILLEVVDQGENGEPILAIPDVDLPVYLPHKEQSSDNEKKLSNEEDVASDSSEHIVVDDEDITLGEAPVKNAAHVMPNLHPDMKDEMIIKRQKGEIKEKSPSRRKKKKKCKERCQPKPVEGRVLRSGTVRNTIHESPKKPDKRSVNKEKKHNLSKVPLVSAPSAFALKPNKPNPCQTKAETEISTTTVLPETKVQVATSVSHTQEAALLIASAKHSHPSCLPTVVQSQKPDEKPEQPAPAPEKVEVPSAAPSTVMPPASLESPAAAPSPMTPPVSEALPSVVSEPEPKPKPLSLAEYRRLRQQKKLTPVESQENLNSSKWPSLPELPKELLPIPCLPDPSPRDPRRHNLLAAKKEVDEVRPAWQPRGPCAPPTPEALLVPPAYMVSSSSRVSAAAPAPKTQKTPEHAKPSVTQKPSSPAPNSAKNLSPHQHTTAVSSVPQSSGAPASLNPDTMLSADRKCSPAPSGEKARDDEKPQSQPVSPKSVELTKTCPATTTESIKPTAAPMSALSSSKKITVVFQKGSEVTAPTLTDNSITSGSKPTKPATNGTRIASGTRPTDSQSLKAELVVLETKGKPTTAVKPQRTKSPTQELVEAFTSEIGIEAADLTSLLEQFEETQAKEEQCKLEVSGRAAAVGNSSVDLFPEKTVVERVRANDLSSTAALTPPGTPPHQMWKPLAPVALLRKSKATEASKSSPARVIQIDARPLPAIRSRSRPTFTTVTPEVACMDHDYCLPNKGAGEPGMRWNVKQQSYITIKPIKTTTQSPRATAVLSVQSTTNGAVTTKTQDFSLTEPLDHRTDEVQRSSVLETPDASPAWQEADDTVKEGSPKKGPFGKTCRRHAASRTPSPRSGPKERTGGQSRKRSHRSPSPMSSHSESDSLSSRSRSRSHSPSKKRYRPRHSSSSSSSSRSSSRSSMSRSPPRRRRYSYSSSRSGSWSRSRSRSQSPQRRSRWSRSRRLYRPSYRPSYGHSTKPNMEKMKKGKEKAIEERRVVYVGRIRGTMTQKELRERFSLFGDIEDCTLHFRDHGDNYGFVTYYETKDAFTAIENGSKLRKPDELPFDLCFGGRRQFCRTSYADLDSIREFDPLPAKGKFHALDFDTLLKQAQQNLKR